MRVNQVDVFKKRSPHIWFPITLLGQSCFVKGEADRMKDLRELLQQPPHQPPGWPDFLQAMSWGFYSVFSFVCMMVFDTWKDGGNYDMFWVLTPFNFWIFESPSPGRWAKGSEELVQRGGLFDDERLLGPLGFLTWLLKTVPKGNIRQQEHYSDIGRLKLQKNSLCRKAAGRIGPIFKKQMNAFLHK